MSQADIIFIDMVKDILQNGYSTRGQKIRPVWADTGEPAHSIKKFGVVNRYDLSKEFPILTLRPTSMKVSIDEILWIWQKKSNNIKGETVSLTVLISLKRKYNLYSMKMEKSFTKNYNMA